MLGEPLPPPPHDTRTLQPMRDELVRVGIRELRSPADVDEALTGEVESVLIVINSVCGCAAGNARPGVMLALQHDVIPIDLVSVFAGQDREATEHLRTRHLAAYPASSPCIVLFSGGRVEMILERHNIEGRSPLQIAEFLQEAFHRCPHRPGPSIPAKEFRRVFPYRHRDGSTPPAERN